MREATARRLDQAVAECGRQSRTGVTDEARTNLLVAKIEYRIEQMLTGAALTDEHRERLCAFVAEVGR